MTQYSKHFSTKKTSQQDPIPGSDQVQNNAGGYSFEVTAAQQFERFLILGAEGGTYYVSEKELTVDNAVNTIAYIKTNGKQAVYTISEISLSGRAAKNSPAIFALALATTFGDEATKSAAYAAISKVCRTGTHLFEFCQYIQDLRGWSRGLRSGVSKFYTGRSLNSLDLQLIKYRQRDGWTHKDVLRLCHANGDKDYNSRFAYVTGNSIGVIEKSDLINAFETIQTVTDATEAAQIVTAYRLPWEAVPTELLNSKQVWAALLPNMGYTALLRNLGKMSTIGLATNNFDEATATIVSMLTNADALASSGVHPFAIFLALKNYSAGRGFRGSNSWPVAPAIVDALNTAFEMSFDNVQPTGKRILVGVDVSGSMSATINNTNISASEAAAAMAYITARIEAKNQVVLFDTSVAAIPSITKRDSLSSIIQKIGSIRGGGTDCAQPILYALNHNLDVDAIVIYTDNETWAGNTHGSQAIAALRKKLGHSVKIVNAATTATKMNSISDPKDLDALGVAGFDASAPLLIADFIKGQ